MSAIHDEIRLRADDAAADSALDVRVLLVEDDDDHAALALGSLDRVGLGPLAVDRAVSSTEALERAATESYDLVVLDYGLSDMDALAVLAKLRAAGSTIPALVLSSQWLERTAAQAPRAHADDYIPKELGLHSDGLGRAVLAILQKRSLADALLRARDRFLVTASHDLKTTITIIKLTAQTLQRRLARGGAILPLGLETAETLAKKTGAPSARLLLDGLSSIDHFANQLLLQIEQMLDMEQPLALHRTSTDLVLLAQRAAAAHQQATERHQIQIEAREPSIKGNWDAVRLERVFGNLLNNAIKYSPKGGPITIRLWIEVVRRGRVAAISIRDRGIGIPVRDLPHIFEPFQRSDQVIGQVDGTGIGLAAVRLIVEQHSGTVGVESEEGSGTTFTIRLPLEAA